MNSGPTPPRSDDEARDPLLAALRQRLSDYGQAPPPGAWAAIRQQLPPAIPRPWWRRPRRLLPLLGLLLGLLTVSTLVIQPRRIQHGSQVLGHGNSTLPSAWEKFLATPNPVPQAKQQEAAAARVAKVTKAASLPSPNSSAPSTKAATDAAPSPKTRQANTLAKQPPRTVTSASETTYSSDINLGSTRVAASPKEVSGARVATLGSTHHHAGSTPLLTTASSARRRTPQQHLGSPAATSSPPAEHQAASHLQGSSAAASSSQKSALALATDAVATDSISRYPTTSPYAKVKKQPRRGERTLATLPLSGRRRGGAAAATRVAGATQGQTPANYPVADEPTGLSYQPTAADSLVLRSVALGLSPVIFSPTLAARPDSFQPMPRPQRWSLLVLAGPTLSYRTLGAAPTLAAQHPDFARLERPAVGLGAQVQVRRVLSGRWALAVGLGYHEYATRLALSIVDSSTRSPRSVHQRDVYRVLTLPVQFSYALGVPRGRLAWALLAGAEPSWYQGGRSTEGSDCGCQQRVYPLDSAKTGPYRPLTLAFSLGLDLRYQLGGPASRWQWVVQPTARYIATPFVRSDAVGFTRRQPWSLGVLTGLSWSFH